METQQPQRMHKQAVGLAEKKFSRVIRTQEATRHLFVQGKEFKEIVLF